MFYWPHFRHYWYNIANGKCFTTYNYTWHIRSQIKWIVVNIITAFSVTLEWNEKETFPRSPTYTISVLEYSLNHYVCGRKTHWNICHHVRSAAATVQFAMTTLTQISAGVKAALWACRDAARRLNTPFVLFATSESHPILNLRFFWSMIFSLAELPFIRFDYINYYLLCFYFFI